MSINFDEKPNAEALQFLGSIMGQEKASDGKSFLFDDMRTINQREMTTLANKAKQPVTCSIHEEGAIKELSDGTRYRVTSRGWIRIVE